MQVVHVLVIGVRLMMDTRLRQTAWPTNRTASVPAFRSSVLCTFPILAHEPRSHPHLGCSFPLEPLFRVMSSCRVLAVLLTCLAVLRWALDCDATLVLITPYLSSYSGLLLAGVRGV